MYETENEHQPVFSSLIKINYDKRFIRTAQSFAENLSLLAGANKEESLQVSLLLEECLVFIIDKYIDCRAAAHIEIFFSLYSDKKLHIEITDIGPPIHAGMIPSFNIEDEYSEAGLWYKLVQGLSDGFDFVNKLNAGWLIKIDKNIKDITFDADGTSGKESNLQEDRERTLGEKQGRWADTNDVPALIDLAYMTYRYTYLMDYYDKEKLKSDIENKRYEIFVVEHQNKIIGAAAVKNSGAGNNFAELGTAMVMPEYRNGNAMRIIIRETTKYIIDNPRCYDFFYVTAVTGHVISQKVSTLIHKGFKPLMLCINMFSSIEFIGIRDNVGSRESLLYMYQLCGKLKTDKIYAASAKHTGIINELITNMENSVTVLTGFCEPENPVSQISIQRVDFLKFASISVEVLGKDWFSSISKNIFSLLASGFESIKVTIPASNPLPADIEKMLSDLNLVFTGLSLRSLEKIDLAFCLTTKPVNFSAIKLYDPVAQKLLKLIEQDYCRI